MSDNLLVKIKRLTEQVIEAEEEISNTLLMYKTEKTKVINIEKKCLEYETKIIFLNDIINDNEIYIRKKDNELKIKNKIILDFEDIKQVQKNNLLQPDYSSYINKISTLGNILDKTNILLYNELQKTDELEKNFIFLNKKYCDLQEEYKNMIHPSHIETNLFDEINIPEEEVTSKDADNKNYYDCTICKSYINFLRSIIDVFASLITYLLIANYY